MKLSNFVSAIDCRELLKDFKSACNGEILKFQGVDGYDVYNPSIPFEIDGKTVIAGRVEKRENEKSQTMFFALQDEEWVLIADAPVLDLQDPFVTFIGDETIVGGVNVVWEGEKLITYKTDFYRGRTLNGLKHFLSGPQYMKDIRLCGMSDGKIAVFSRPQGVKIQEKYNCIAKIGFTIANCLGEITPQLIDEAPLLEGQFLPTEWGGANQIYMLKNGLLGIIGHKSYLDGEGENLRLHYHGIAFVIDPISREISPCKIISTRSCFPKGPTKYLRTEDVTFTSGIVREKNNIATLYTGLSDCQAGKITINDPFAEYENQN